MLTASAPILVLVVRCLTGGSAWRIAPEGVDSPVPKRKAFEIWSQGRSAIVHGVRLHGDTVPAVPRWRPPECDSCAILFSRSAIDSVRERRFSKGRTVGLVAVGVVALTIYALVEAAEASVPMAY